MSLFEGFIKRVYEATEIDSQLQLASVIGVNRSAITQARKKNSVPESWILRLYKTYGLNPEWLESGSGKVFLNAMDDHSEFSSVPKVKARLCAGGGSFESGSEIDGYYSFSSEWLVRKGNSRSMVLMDVFGNSMEPEFKDGDTVLIDESQKKIMAGAVYAIGIDDTIMVKRIEKHPSKMVLLSDNKNYAPIYLEREEMDSVRIIGKVIWSCREYR